METNSLQLVVSELQSLFGQTSTTYNVFSILQLPVPNARSGKIAIERCLDAFFDEEILEKDDAWYVETTFWFHHPAVKQSIHYL